MTSSPSACSSAGRTAPRRRGRTTTSRASGQDLLPVLQGLLQWGDRWVAEAPPVELHHDGHRADLAWTCRTCGRTIGRGAGAARAHRRRPRAAGGPPWLIASWGEPSSRTVTWYDPMQVAAAGLSMTGLELLEAVRDGRLPPPPISQLFQMGVNSVQHGARRVHAATSTSRRTTRSASSTAAWSARCSTRSSAAPCTPRCRSAPATPRSRSRSATCGPCTARAARWSPSGEVVKPGRRVAFAEGEVRDAAGKVVATATSTLLVFSTSGAG